MVVASCLAIGQRAAFGTDKSAPDDPVARLIAQLGDDDYFVRERAQQQLARIGFEAFDALEAAQEDEDIEIASRAKYLVSQMQIEWTVATDPPDVKQLLQNYGQKDETAHAAIVEKLNDLPDDKGLGVLCRLVRFDKSLVVSKLAALAIIKTQRVREQRWQAREKVITDNLGHSPRPGAQWLRAYLAAHRDAADGAERWGQLAEQEQQALAQQPQQTRPQIVCALRRQQVAALRKLDRRDEAVAAMMHLVDLEEGTNETLVELFNWLVEQEAWTVVDTVAKRFADRIEREPILLYSLAQAQQVQGQDEVSQQTAGRALAMYEGNTFDSLVHHFQVARELQRRGMLPWAQQEYRHIIEVGTAGEIIPLYAQRGLAELLHDQGDDLGAATYWEAMLTAREAKEKNKDGEAQEFTNRFGPIEPMRARWHFFRACAAGAKGEPATQLAELKTGLEDDPTEVDVLIALFHHASVEPEFKEKVRGLIREAADGYRREMQESPDDSTPYNQFAWLIANTEGDATEARRASEKSLELLRNQADEKDVRMSEPGYLDTLARCHFAEGDLSGAVEIQSKAVEMDPHSGQMRKQLKLFRLALAEKQRQAQ